MVELPENIRDSEILTLAQLQLLAAVDELPVIDASFEDEKLKNIYQYYSLAPADMDVELQRYAAELLSRQKIKEAWQVLLSM